MKKILALALVLALALAVTHGWVAAVAYNAEQRAKELGVDYKVATSANAEEMTTQLADLLTWGATAIVAFPQWSGMEDPIKEALDKGVVVVNFDIDIAVDGVYKVTGDNYDMGVQGAKYIVDKVGDARGAHRGLGQRSAQGRFRRHHQGNRPRAECAVLRHQVHP